jgi:hypothetical protein
VDEKRSEKPAVTTNGKKVQVKPEPSEAIMEAKQPRQFVGKPNSTEVRK